MRQKRAKTYKRVMALYTQAFGFRQPFQVLVANDLLLETAKQDLDIFKQLSLCVQGETKPMITQCCMEALYKLGKEFQLVIDVAKRFERRRCNHREAILPEECLKDVVGPTNKHRYILAIQSPALINSLSAIPGLPLIHFNPRHVLVLSPPSTSTIRVKNKEEEERRLEGGKILEGLDEGGNVIGAGSNEGRGASAVSKTGTDYRGGRKIKGVNPLSVKKKKTSRTVTFQPPKSLHVITTDVVEGSSSKIVGEAESSEDGGELSRNKKRLRGDGKGDDGIDLRLEKDGSGNEETVAGENDSKRKKKRRRRGKGVVADAIAQIKSGELMEDGGGQVLLPDNGDGQISV